MQKRVSIGQVARAAGVDHATASRALSRHPHVAAATRARILTLAEQLGYRPDPALAAMARDRWLGRARRNANVLAYVASAPLAQAVREEHYLGARDEAERLGWRIEAVSLADYTDAALARVLHTRGIQGLLLRIDRPGARPPELPWERLAAVHLSLPPDRAPWLDTALPDTFGIHHRAMREVLARGYRRPGLVLLAPRFLADEVRRVGGVLAAWSEADVRSSAPPVWWIDPKEKPGTAATELAAWIARHRLDAVLGQTDHVAEVLRAAGHPLPGPLGFVSLSAGRAHEPHTRALPDLRRVGATAAALVAARLHQRQHGLPESPLQLTVPGHWVEGVTLPAVTPTGR